MGIRFESPWILLLLLPLLFFLIQSVRSPARRGKTRKAISLTLRAVLLLALIASAAGIEALLPVKERAVFYVADRSESMPAAKAYEEWLRQSAAAKGARDQVGVIATGLDSAVERSLSKEPLTAWEFAAQVNRLFSNPGAGLQLAGGLLPAEADSRVVLVTDGQENAGDLARQAKLLKDRGIILDILPLATAARPDVAVESVKVPGSLYQAEKYTLEITLNSTLAADGELRVYEDNNEISRSSVRVEKGVNRYAVQALASSTGLHRYRAEIYFANDEVNANNAGYAFSRVSGSPQVLIVEGVPGSSANLVSVLESGLIGHTVIPPERLSRELADYAAYDSLILNNVPATKLSGKTMQLIEQAVRDYGMGLVMTGGDESFGMGGYFKTPIEQALPVKMELTGKREIPPLAIMLVIDRSGSMSGDKMELAKEAAMRTVELLREQDTVGVLAFDSSPWWVVEPTRLTEKDDVLNRIGSIQSQGGTDIYPAAAAAYQKLVDVNAERKHIILLTDGQSAGSGSYEALTADMVAKNITMSTVAVGNDSDQRLLKSLAELAKGRYYFTDDQSTIPAIFSRETVLLSRTYIVDKPFVPAIGQAAEWSKLFQGGVPQVNAYIATTPKDLAEVSLLTPEPDPLLARWQYGSGRAVAWTSDVTGKWAPDWTGWEKFSDTFSQIIKWTFPQFQASPVEITAETTGANTELLLDSQMLDSASGAAVTVTGDDLAERKVNAIPTAPGEFRTELGELKPGTYLTRVEMQDTTGSTLGGTSTGFVVPYSPEYRITETDPTDKLKALAEQTGGRLLSLDHPEEVFRGPIRLGERRIDLRLALLILALLLWPLDIASRRLALPWQRFASALSRLRHPLRGRLAPAAASAADVPAAMTRLRSRQERARAFYGADGGSGGKPRPSGDSAPDSQPAARPPSRGEQSAASATPAAKKTAPRTVAAESPLERAAASAAPKPPEPPQNGGSAASPGSSGDAMSRLLAAKNRKKS
ncbi:VWA domain-containing protein [Gorillibacterium timonense]|uniref:VWA domain-containing protein n=1 Tax=Gorillibacterium timonense TaxID=1689269 RepID=UPI00071D68C7|nr:VWA domain-containing protein [Gorillibacterium timonense]